MSSKTVIITGAARGIGLSCARRFFEDGWNVVLVDNDEAAGEAAMEELVVGDPDHKRAVFVNADISEPLHVHNLIAETLTSFGSIDCLINNAGIVMTGGIRDLDVADFDRVLATNLRGAFLVAQAVVRQMLEEIESRDDRSRLSERPYSIINMSSINDRLAIPEILAYVVSKGGLGGMTRSMAIELAPYGIRVNSIAPGSIRTDMAAGVLSDPDAFDRAMSRTPLGRMGNADEVAGVAAFLASEDASYMTGETLYVDGGRSALNYVMPKRQTDEPQA
jgi:NAD(P)-dependent dehydrogenase (short-subunit alcohol dehydrogenase family)